MIRISANLARFQCPPSTALILYPPSTRFYLTSFSLTLSPQPRFSRRYHDWRCQYPTTRAYAYKPGTEHASIISRRCVLSRPWQAEWLRLMRSFDRISSSMLFCLVSATRLLPQMWRVNFAHALLEFYSVLAAIINNNPEIDRFLHGKSRNRKIENSERSCELIVKADADEE